MSNDVDALRTLCSKIFGRNNLIGTDFADVSVKKITKELPQSPGGGRQICFTISHNAIGKILDDEASDALEVLDP